MKMKSSFWVKIGIKEFSANVEGIGGWRGERKEEDNGKGGRRKRARCTRKRNKFPYIMHFYSIKLHNIITSQLL